MKILLGSHGVGKSTLLEGVNKHFPDYYVTDGFSRPVYKIANILDLSDLEKQIVINELSTWAYQNYLSHKNVISTRSIIDCIIYSHILTPDLDIDGMLDLFRKTQQQVEYFFYIPVEFDFVEDKQRLGPELQLRVDAIILEFMEKYVPSERIVTISGTIEERLKTISKYL